MKSHTPNSLVSVIIPTRNSAKFLNTCLSSIKNQTYKNIEIIVVDNNSTDNTKKIAKKYTDKVFNKGPERSAQRNFGAKKANADYFLFIDSDMELSTKVVEECVKKIQSDNKIKALVIPEESIGEGFWAQCKKLERNFYIGVDWIEAARFFPKNIFNEFNGYDERLTSGEDWDLSQRVKKKYSLDRIDSFIYHNEGKLLLSETIKKKMYYGTKIGNYSSKEENRKGFKSQSSIIKRYKLFFSNPRRLFSNPIIGVGMLFMKTCEFIAVGLGYIFKK